MSFRQRVIAPEDMISHEYTDVKGQTLESRVFGVEDMIVRYQYNSIGELTAYADAEDLPTSYEYDMLGRQVKITNQDFNTIDIFYDKASNITKKITANLEDISESIDYDYDFNRPTRITYPEIQGMPNLANVEYFYGNSGNETGRLIAQTDATGQMEYKYGKMGEVVETTRTIVAPNLPDRYFITRYEYDSWNRILRMIYPDQEAVDYVYNEAGALDKIIGDEIYIRNIDYDKFGHRVQVELGNQNIERFTYTPEMQRLANKQVVDANSNLLFDRSYLYDQLGNVTRYRGNAGVYQGSQDPAGVMGGNYEFNFTYDDQNRLQTANGLFDGEPSQQQFGNNFMSNFNLSMDYTSTGGIKEKNQEHVQDNAINNNNTYNNVYTYFDNTHKVKNITDQNSGLITVFDYDLNGNMIFATDGQSFENNYFWDEENRLRVVKDINLMHHYIYDANGERVLKSSSNFISVEENGTVIGNETAFQNYTTYASPQIVIDANNNYTKHYFEADTRIVTRLGGDASLFQNPPTSPRPASTGDSGADGKKLDTEKLKDLQKSDLAHYFKKAEIESTPSFKPFKNNSVVTQNEEDDATEALEELLGLETFSEPQTNNQASAIFFYHADHLGSNEVISDETGAPHEFHLTLPFGETMVEQRKPMANYYNSWKFTGKELDSLSREAERFGKETGLYYFGARYYQPSWSIWLSVDPLAEQAPDWTPYRYGFNNPLKYIDPDGMFEENGNCCPVPKEVMELGQSLVNMFNSFFKKKKRPTSKNKPKDRTDNEDSGNNEEMEIGIFDIYSDSGAGNQLSGNKPVPGESIPVNDDDTPSVGNSKTKGGKLFDFSQYLYSITPDSEENNPVNKFDSSGNKPIKKTLHKSDAKGKPREEHILGFNTQAEANKAADSIERNRTPLNRRDYSMRRGGAKLIFKYSDSLE